MMVIWNKNITACCLIELKKSIKLTAVVSYCQNGNNKAPDYSGAYYTSSYY